MSDERRQTDPAPTTVQRAIQRMPDDEKVFLRKVGLGISVFALVVPVLAEIALEVVQPEGDGLWWGLWAFCVLGFLGGLCFMSETIGVRVLGVVARLVEVVIPAALKAKYPTRGEP